MIMEIMSIVQNADIENLYIEYIDHQYLIKNIGGIFLLLTTKHTFDIIIKTERKFAINIIYVLIILAVREGLFIFHDT